MEVETETPSPVDMYSVALPLAKGGGGRHQIPRPAEPLLVKYLSVHYMSGISGWDAQVKRTPPHEPASERRVSRLGATRRREGFPTLGDHGQRERD
ncbi:hypothetical protein LY78DRAFT_713782 [Colletotrichum sublineola]|nr:hypothetical protein LY78DRAFT_713782 [Colletotrichum sublineola]